MKPSNRSANMRAAPFPKGLVPFAACLALVSVMAHASQADSSPSGEGLTLEQAETQALESHPQLVSARRAIQVAEGRLVHAGRRANPSFTLNAENLPFSPSPDYDFDQNFNLFAFVTQPIGLWNKRGRRMDVARADLEAAQAELSRVEREVAYRVGVSFAEALRRRARLRLIESGESRWLELVERNRLRVAEGFLAEGDLIRTRVEAARYAHSLRLARQDYERSLIELVSATGSRDFESLPDPVELNPPDSGALVGEGEDLDGKLSRHRESIAARPEIRLAEARVAAAESQWRLASLAWKPDPTAMFGYKRNGLDNTLLVGMTIPLPLLHRSPGESAAALGTLDVFRAELDWSYLQASAELEIAIRGYEQALERLEALGEEFVSDARESLAVVEAAYREGAVELIAVVDADRAHREAVGLFLDAQYETRVARMELNRVSGLPSGARAELQQDSGESR